jgi:hypothetical protein
VQFDDRSSNRSVNGYKLLFSLRRNKYSNIFLGLCVCKADSWIYFRSFLFVCFLIYDSTKSRLPKH